MASYRGKKLELTLFGQSHAPAVGMVLSGLPAGETPDPEALRAFLKRRAPGQDPWASPRREADEPLFLCGLTEKGVTCGAPLTVILENTDARPEDYEALPFRPGHADLTAWLKYAGSEDARGGGPFSGRLTAALCAAGGVCLQILARRGIRIGAHTAEIAGIPDRPFDPMGESEETFRSLAEKRLPVLDDAAGERMRQAMEEARDAGDSVGGTVEAMAIGLPAGLGGPLTDGLESRLSALLFAIPAVRGVEFGMGFAAAALRGSAHNDPIVSAEGEFSTASNHAGGLLGGITDGMPLYFRVAFKPTPSVSLPQQTVGVRGEAETLRIRGRHDPCIVPRAVPAVEAAAAIVLLDALLDRQTDFLRGEERP